MAGLSDDPSDLPTRLTDYGADGWQRVLEHEPGSEHRQATTPDGAPVPWYRKRVLLALWALMVALLVTLLIYGLVHLAQGGETTGPAPSTSTTTPSRSSTTSPSATTPPTTTETPPPPQTPEQTPEQAPPPANNSPSPAPPPRHHHHFHLPHLF